MPFPPGAWRFGLEDRCRVRGPLGSVKAMERIELSFFRLRDGCLGQHKLHRPEDWSGREGAAVVASLSLHSLRRVAFSPG